MLLRDVAWRLQIKTFAAINGVHVWLVAHPKQLQQWKGDAPTLYDIAGSAHFINKADVGIVVHRDFEGAIQESQGESSRTSSGPEHPLADDPFACRVIIRKVRPPRWFACLGCHLVRAAPPLSLSSF